MPYITTDSKRSAYCPKPENGWNIPSDLLAQLADPLFDTAGPIELLIGAGTLSDLLDVERISLGNGSLSLQATKFGWIVTGEIGATCLLNI